MPAPLRGCATTPFQTPSDEGEISHSLCSASPLLLVYNSGELRLITASTPNMDPIIRDRPSEREVLLSVLFDGGCPSIGQNSLRSAATLPSRRIAYSRPDSILDLARAG